ncbi:FtsW/RodA/SpoVE family cell cycle protein [Demequina sp. SYSU T00039]|uniref:Probable peptidoglycan glycosyltransferase FtsW n=1 Tax=Demequina lignilytica TaxID=3051663 RepID=A0AAW7LZW9_9MICO|nr:MULTISPECIES: FtsW/RodA/SpoVE family cell cycle protein [unclassified Demequina]MDN4477115.1 FtsW/RodA/SpoVE family cell cycle protein [Demequina sp. SYSU T00039-1]MDN4487288.1 FtsW/RodA/SpoVE family cell cycle protein [Demequina sp. SYSU T00039]MDN4491539.1 FtsW/RodA/SpoVE family cell cycle protein [Demequina sp. SYSU T00068]
MTATESRPQSAVTAFRSPATSYYLLVAATTILVLLGLAVVLSSSSISSIRSGSGSAYSGFIVQVIALVVGVVALVVGSRMPVMFWKRIAPWVLFASIGLLLMVLAGGRTVGGNKAWIDVAGFSFQPSEFAKLGLALYLGVVLSRFRHKLTNLRDVFVPGGLVALGVIGLVLVGGDLGTALMMGVVVAVAFWVAGAPARFFGIAGALVGLGVLALVNTGTTRIARIVAWAEGSCSDVNECWQQTHGTWALASGGLWGLGPGMSREKWGYLPAADNDYIFAIIGEEFGLVGTVVVLVAFAMLLIAVTRIVTRSTDRFTQIAAAAIGAWLVVQACVNIAVVLQLLPVLGVPLPLVSSGGSSLILSLTAVGVLMSLARHEPGAQEAFKARPSVVRRSLAVVAKGTRRMKGRRRG